MPPSQEVSIPLLHDPARPKVVVKPRCLFGYLPVRSECVPLNPETGKVDGVRVIANILAGCIIGIRQALSAIVSATLVYTTSGVPEVTAMFPFGIGMMWWATVAGSTFYAIFGRLQYNTNATQEVCAILYGAMAQSAATLLKDDPARIAPTVVALIMVGTVLTGVCSVVFGRLGIGKAMLCFPSPVTMGFLGTIGFFLVRIALQIASGVTFKYFYPVDLELFCTQRALLPVSCLLTMTLFMRKGPAMLKLCFPSSTAVKKLGPLFCQLLPLGLFYVYKFATKTTMDELSDANWTFPAQASKTFTTLWTTYDLREADMGVIVKNIPEMFSLVLMSVLCTMTGVLGITGKFPTGPDGDPNPMEVVDFDGELTTSGWGSIFIGLSNGVVTFHRLGSSIQLRTDGGTHRIGVLSSAIFVAVFFFSSVPLGHYIPKFFLGGLFMGSGVSFLEGAFLSYRTLPPSNSTFFGRRLPSRQYWVTVICILVAVFTSPTGGIGAGLALSVVLFLYNSSTASPVASMSAGNRTVSRTLRPFWELRILRKEGRRIVILYLQGQIFFGSWQPLAEALSALAEDDEEDKHNRFCVLSFAKVSGVDSSAAQQLCAAIKRISRHGWKVICCRTSPSVFDALAAAKVIVSPNADLRKVLQIGVDDCYSHVEENNGDDEASHEINLVVDSSKQTRRSTFRALGAGADDAFDHEADALDYCDEQLLEEFCYGEKGGSTDTALEGHMKLYRMACRTGGKLTNEAFEDINRMPRGSLSQLKEFCEVQTDLQSGTELSSDDSMFLILQGAVALVDIDPTVDSVNVDELNITHPKSMPSIHTRGFGGRGGKRLHKRYPCGNLVGYTTFYLKFADRLVDAKLMPRLFISSKLGFDTEVWELCRAKYDQLPADLQKTVIDLINLKMVEERQHTLLSGE